MRERRLRRWVATLAALMVTVASLLLAHPTANASPRESATSSRSPAGVLAQGSGQIADCNAGSTPSLTPSPEQLLDRIGVTRPPTNYIFAIDTSGSMQQDGRYSQVLTELKQFEQSLCPNDQIAVVLFSDNAQTAVPLVPLGQVGDVTSLLPATATGANTDIGAGLAAAVDELGQAPQDTQSAIVLLTDGNHQPGLGSSFPSPNGGPWTQLAARASSVTANHPVKPVAIPLVGDSGVTALQQVFPNGEVSPGGSPALLGVALGRAQQETRLAAAADLLRVDAAATIDASWEQAGPTDMTSGQRGRSLVLRSQLQRFPVTLSNIRVTSDDGYPVQGSSQSPPLTLLPGQRATVAVPLTWAPPTDSTLLPGVRHYDSHLVVTADIASTEATGIAALLPGNPVQFAPHLTGGSLDLTGAAPQNWNIVGFVLLLLLLVVVVAVIALLVSRRRRATPAIVGAATTSGGRGHRPTPIPDPASPGHVRSPTPAPRPAAASAATPTPQDQRGPRALFRSRTKRHRELPGGALEVWVREGGGPLTGSDILLARLHLTGRRQELTSTTDGGDLLRRSAPDHGHVAVVATPPGPDSAAPPGSVSVSVRVGSPTRNTTVLLLPGVRRLVAGYDIRLLPATVDPAAHGDRDRHAGPAVAATPSRDPAATSRPQR